MENLDYIGISEEEALKRNEKQSVRHTAMFIGIVMLITAAVSLFFATIYFNITSLFGIDRVAAAEFVNEPFGNELINQLLSVCMFVFPFLIVLSGCSLKFAETVSFTKADKNYFLPLVLLGIGCCGFTNIAGNLMFQFLEGIGIQIPMTDRPSASGVLGIIVSIVGTGIIAPLTEEFAMRGIVMGSLRKYGDRFAIVASSVLFGIMHANLQQIPFAFVVGLALGFAVVKTGSIWTGVIIHAINNLFATVLGIIGDKIPLELSYALNLSFFAICILCGIVSVLFLKRKEDETEILPRGKALLGTRENLKSFFSSPMIILYIAVVAVQIVTRL